MSRPRKRFALILAAVAVVALSAILFACSQTPVSVPIRTFDRAQRVDVVCLRVYGENAPLALPQEECAPVPPDINGGNFQNRLFALVTQTTRGEVAVVDLSAGVIVDQRHAIPGLNFLPVGSNPTDVASTPDGKMVFVSSAEPNKFAIYGIPGHRILGDEAPTPDPDGPIALTSWPVCSLPQRPSALSIVPRRTNAGVADGGLPVTPVTAGDVPYEVVAVLAGDRTTTSKVVTIDPKPFLRGSPHAGDTFGEGPVLQRGVIAPCPITAATELSGEDVLPASFRSSSRWQDGVPWVDGGVDLSCEQPAIAASCGLRSCACANVSPPPPNDGGQGNDGGSGNDGGPLAEPTCEDDAGSAEEPEHVLDLGPLDPPHPVAIARDDQTLYVADEGVPLIHIIDLSTPGAPRELPPLVVTSVVEPTRAVSIADIAISPPTHDYKRFLYAVDRKQGSIAVFDVTDPVNAERTPMLRPHAELNPFQSPDRISFASPVVSIAFARHDVPISRVNGGPISNPPTGLLCNPNPNVSPAQGANGAQYRNDSQGVDVVLGPRPTTGRLRGIFAFATLSNGQVVAIDVDDWDAPCRRPAVLAGGDAPETTTTSVLASIAQPTPGDGDVDPYHAPDLSKTPTSVSQEVFFPVSAPHRARSNYFLRDDPTTGKYLPYLSALPSITAKGAVSPPLVGPGSESTPLLRPTIARLYANRHPGVEVLKQYDADIAATKSSSVQFSFDTPDVHFDQDWTVTYEGAIPGFDGLTGTLSTTDGYASVVLSQPQGAFCARGVEDWSMGYERATAIDAALATAGRAPYPASLGKTMADYVQVADNILAWNDPFWSQEETPGDAEACWDGRPAKQRYDYCAQQFGSADDESLNRDFPILEAYQDRLVLGQFDENRIVVSGTADLQRMKALRCCFHHQVKFKVRTGGQWLTNASAVGFLHHVTAGSGGRCVSSCDPNAALLNSRAPSLPYDESGEDFAPFRDSPLAMRNPAFSFFIQNGYWIPPTKQARENKKPDRDMVYRFSTRGGFQPLFINLASQTTAVIPQSMRFIESLGQIAVVDGASQGLVLIDLAGVAIARNPYF